jgi:DNA replication protein DnaC
MMVNGDGALKSPAHLAFGWLKYSLMSDPRKWVWFYGEHGMGKSHLACVTGAFWIRRMNRSGKYVQWANYLDKVRKGFKLDKNGETLPADIREADAQALIGMGILVLDDLASGKTSFTDWAVDQLYLVLDGRVGKPTILVSNLTLSQYVDRLLATGWDAAPKVADRLGSGKGGNVAGSIRFKSKHGSYRQKNGGVHA